MALPVACVYGGGMESDERSPTRTPRQQFSSNTTTGIIVYVQSWFLKMMHGIIIVGCGSTLVQQYAVCSMHGARLVLALDS